MGGETKTQSGTQTATPWAGAIPHLNEIMGNAQRLYTDGTQGIGTAINPTGANAPINPMLNIGQAGMTYKANTDAVTGAASYPWNDSLKQIQGGGLSPDMQSQIGKLQGMAGGDDNNPYLQQMLDTQANRLRNQVGSTMAGGGRYGSAGHQDALVRSISEAQNPILMQAYENNRNRMLQANQAILGAQGQGAQRALGYSALAPELDSLQYRPFERISAVGDYLQGRDQAELDLTRANFNRAQLMPWENLGRYGEALGYTSPFSANAVSKTTTATEKSPNSFMDYMKLFTPNAGGYSSAGSILGGIGSLAALSDREAKTDIKKVGTNERTGLDIFAYRYKGDPKSYPKVVGPMAQDIEKKYPGSTERIDGMLVVKPKAVGLLEAV
jgi:hypothetical protein